MSSWLATTLSIEHRTHPCRIPGCKLPVLQGNDEWHIRYDTEGGFVLSHGHDLSVNPEDDIWEMIEEYD